MGTFRGPSIKCTSVTVRRVIRQVASGLAAPNRSSDENEWKEKRSLFISRKLAGQASEDAAWVWLTH